MRGLQLVARIGHLGDQAAHPGIQFQLQQTAILGGADVFALDKLQIMGDTRQQEDVRQTGVDARVGRGVSGVVQRRFLGGVGRKEAGVIAVFVVGQRNEAQTGEFKFAGFRDHHFGRDFHLIAGTEVVQMDWQVFHRATGLRASNLYTPAVTDEALDHIGCKGERRAGPQVLLVVRAFHFFDVVEAANRYGIRAIRQTTEHARHHQTYVAGIVGVTERFPLDVFSAVEVVADVFDSSNLLHVVL